MATIRQSTRTSLVFLVKTFRVISCFNVKDTLGVFDLLLSPSFVI